MWSKLKWGDSCKMRFSPSAPKTSEVSSYETLDTAGTATGAVFCTSLVCAPKELVTVSLINGVNWAMILATKLESVSGAGRRGAGVGLGAGAATLTSFFGLALMVIKPS